jgi:hypothetical protein
MEVMNLARITSSALAALLVMRVKMRQFGFEIPSMAQEIDMMTSS